MPSTRSSIALLLGGGASLWAAFFAAPALAKDHYQRVAPPPTTVEGMKKVAIVDVGGGWSKAWQQGIAAALRGRLGHAEGVPEADPGLHSDVFDFATVQGPQVPGVEEVKQIGSSADAQAVLVAIADGKETEYANYEEGRTRRIDDGNGKSHEEKYTVPCARRKVEASGSWTLYSAEDGTVFAKDSFSSGAQDADCNEGGKDTLSVRSADDLIGALIGPQAPATAAQFAPRWEIFSFKYMREQSTREAIDAADGGDWVTAVEDSKATLADDPYNAAAVYHIGLALELGGRPGDAATLFGFAKRLKDVGVYADALTGARKRVGELEKLHTLGLDPKPVTYGGVDAILDRANKAADVAVLGTAAAVKGTKNKRLPVLSSASGEGEPVAMVPGGTEIRLIKADGALDEVQLPDGVQGWMDAKSVK